MKLNPVPYVVGLYRSKSLSREPIIIGGCERSGTTLLQSILSAHPSILAVPNETWAFAAAARAGLKGGRIFRMERLWKALGQSPILPTHRRWAEKSPANIFQFQEISQHFGGAVRLIQIVRDGRDVVTSIHPHSTEPWVPVQRWIDAVSAGLAFSGSCNVLTIRYEDLVVNPITTMQEIFCFINEKIPGRSKEEQEEWLENWSEHAAIRNSYNLLGSRIGPIHSRSVGKWSDKNALFRDRAEALVADPIGRDLLILHGYEI